MASNIQNPLEGRAVRSTGGLEPEKVPAADAPDPESPRPVPDHEIARLAHRYWEERKGVGGSAEEDWLRAERELLQRPGA